METTIKNNPPKLYRKAFSLVELLVVITIMAILSVVAYTAVGGQTAKAKDAKRKSDLDTIQNALEVYYIENGDYPPVDTETGTFEYKTADGLTVKQLSKIPVDPVTKQPYPYEVDNAVSPQAYQLAATLHNGGSYQAYVAGNGEALMSGVKTPTSGASSCSGAGEVVDGSTDCVPYQIW